MSPTSFHVHSAISRAESTSQSASGVQAFRAALAVVTSQPRLVVMKMHTRWDLASVTRYEVEGGGCGVDLAMLDGWVVGERRQRRLTVDAMPAICPKEGESCQALGAAAAARKALSPFADNFDEKLIIKSRPPRPNEPNEMTIMPGNFFQEAFWPWPGPRALPSLRAHDGSTPSVSSAGRRLLRLS